MRTCKVMDFKQSNEFYSMISAASRLDIKTYFENMLLAVLITYVHEWRIGLFFITGNKSNEKCGVPETSKMKYNHIINIKIDDISIFQCLYYASIFQCLQYSSIFQCLYYASIFQCLHYSSIFRCLHYARSGRYVEALDRRILSISSKCELATTHLDLCNLIAVLY